MFVGEWVHAITDLMSNVLANFWKDIVTPELGVLKLHVKVESALRGLTYLTVNCFLEEEPQEYFVLKLAIVHHQTS